LEIDLLTFLFN